MLLLNGELRPTVLGLFTWKGSVELQTELTGVGPGNSNPVYHLITSQVFAPAMAML